MSWNLSIQNDSSLSLMTLNYWEITKQKYGGVEVWPRETGMSGWGQNKCVCLFATGSLHFHQASLQRSVPRHQMWEKILWLPLWSCVGLYVVSQRASRVSYRNSRILSVRMNDTLVNHTTVWIIYIVSQRIAYKIRKIWMTRLDCWQTYALALCWSMSMRIHAFWDKKKALHD